MKKELLIEIQRQLDLINNELKNLENTNESSRIEELKTQVGEIMDDVLTYNELDKKIVEITKVLKRAKNPMIIDALEVSLIKHNVDKDFLLKTLEDLYLNPTKRVKVIINKDLVNESLVKAMQNSLDLATGYYNLVEEELNELNFIDKNGMREYDTLNENINELESCIEEIEEDIYNYNQLIESGSVKDLKSTEKLLEKKYLFKNKQKTKDYSFTNKKLERTIISLFLTCFALGMSSLFINKFINKDKSNTNKPETNQEDTIVTEEPQIIEETGFYDINNREQVSLRAQELLESITLANPQNDFSIEELEDILKWINGGLPNDSSENELVFLMERLNILFNTDLVYAIQKYAGIESRTKTTAIEMNKFFLDNGKGQELLSKLDTERKSFINGKIESGKKFNEIVTNSVILNGNNEIDMTALEYAGQELFLNIYTTNFLSGLKYLEQDFDRDFSYSRSIKVDGREKIQTFTAKKNYQTINDVECNGTNNLLTDAFLETMAEVKDLETRSR